MDLSSIVLSVIWFRGGNTLLIMMRSIVGALHLYITLLIIFQSDFEKCSGHSIYFLSSSSNLVCKFQPLVVIFFSIDIYS